MASMTFYSPIAQYGAEKECFELVFRYCEHCKGSVTFENDAAEYGGHSVRSQQIFTTLEAQVAHAHHANPFGRSPSVGPRTSSTAPGAAPEVWVAWKANRMQS